MQTHFTAINKLFDDEWTDIWTIRLFFGKVKLLCVDIHLGWEMKSVGWNQNISYVDKYGISMVNEKSTKYIRKQFWWYIKISQVDIWITEKTVLHKKYSITYAYYP